MLASIRAVRRRPSKAAITCARVTAFAAARRASSRAAKYRSCSSTISGSAVGWLRREPMLRSDSINSGSSSKGGLDPLIRVTSRVAVVVAYRASQLRIAQRRVVTGTCFEPTHEIGQSLTSERVPRQHQDSDGPLDGRRRALDFDEIVHPWIALEPDCRPKEIILPDLAVDRHRHDETELLEDPREILVVTDKLAAELFALLVAIGNRRRTLPVD